jgi:Regulator of chromosome condensation (RCC1) repeat
VRSIAFAFPVASLSACGFLLDLGTPRTLGPADGGDEGDHGGGAPEVGVAPDAGGAADAGVAPDAGAGPDGGIVLDVDVERSDGGDDAERPDDAEAGSPADNADAAPKAVSIAVGDRQACATIEVALGSPDNGTVRCWGSNDGGELGSPPGVLTSDRPLPVAGASSPAQGSSAVLGNVNVLALAAGYSCAISNQPDGFLLCWGAVPSGLGVQRAGSAPPYVPAEMYLYASQLTQVRTASVGAGGGCCTHTDPTQTLNCWGNVQPGGGVSIDGSVGVSQFFASVVVGRAHACGIVTNPTPRVVCWGANDHGQAGQPNSITVSTPLAVNFASTGGTVVQIAAGGDDSCALFDDGSVYCWGANDVGQLGPSAVGESYSPVRVTFDTGDSMAPPMPAPGTLTLGTAHACVVISPNIWCWGSNAAAQLGIGTNDSKAHPTPTRVQRSSGPLFTASQVSAGGNTTCATLASNGFVYCWGANDDAQAGQKPAGFIAYATAVAW